MKIMGHRGARHEAPENTLAGIEVGLRAGCEAIEIDVHLSADGKLVVIHDDTVDRTTNGTGAVIEQTFADLRALDAGDGQQIPTLAEVLDAVRGKAELFVEIKAAGCEQPVVDAARAAGLVDATLVKAFDHRFARATKLLEPGLRVGCLLYGRPLDPAGVVRAAGGDFISLSAGFVDAELVEAAHAGGIAVCAWNCNDPAEVARFAATGLDWLGTDVPTKVAAAR